LYPRILGFHGVSVAASAAAGYHGGNLLGVAPEATIVSYNINTTGQAVSRAGAVLALADGARKGGFEIYNFSFGGVISRSTNNATFRIFHEGYQRALVDARNAGSLIVTAIGNQGIDTNSNLFTHPNGFPQVLAVGGSGIRVPGELEKDALGNLSAAIPAFPLAAQPGNYDVLAVYSGYGHVVDVAAPAGDFPCGKFYPDVNAFNGCLQLNSHAVLHLDEISIVFLSPACAPTDTCGYARLNLNAGTSFAAPKAAGAAALVIQHYRDRHGVSPSPQQIISILKRTADQSRYHDLDISSNVERPRFGLPMLSTEEFIMNYQQTMNAQDAFGAGVIDVKAAMDEIDRGP